MKRIFLLLITFFVISVPAFATDWFHLGTSLEHSEWYVDVSSISTHALTPMEEHQNQMIRNLGLNTYNYPYKSVWVKIVDADESSIIEQVYIYQNKTVAVVNYAKYDSSGSVIDYESNKYPNPSAIYPGSLIENLYNVLY